MYDVDLWNERQSSAVIQYEYRSQSDPPVACRYILPKKRSKVQVGQMTHNKGEIEMDLISCALFSGSTP